MSSRLYKILLILGIVFIIVALSLFWLYWRQPEKLEVDFLDVGQGDAILIKAPAGQNILIDGGPDKAILKRLAENTAWWDKQIDLMILTHPHDDHVSGLIDVIKRYQVKEILYSGVIHNSPNFLAWLELIKNKKIKLTIIDRPQTVKLGQNCQLEIIYPQESFLGKEVENLNDSSLAVKLIYGQTKFLFTGDLEQVAEEKILASSVNIAANVLKVGHHGSDTSSSEAFLDKVQPQFAVISVGKDNDFGHPSLRVIKRLERLGAKVLRTDQEGTVRLVSDGAKVELSE